MKEHTWLEGGDQLLERCCRKFGWTAEFGWRVLEGYRQFLVCKVQTIHVPSVDSAMEPSPSIRKMWKQHIFDSVSYLETCRVYFGIDYIHHSPDDDEDNDEICVSRASSTTNSRHSSWQPRNLDALKVALIIAHGFSAIDPEVWHLDAEVWHLEDASHHQAQTQFLAVSTQTCSSRSSAQSSIVENEIGAAISALDSAEESKDVSAAEKHPNHLVEAMSTTKRGPVNQMGSVASDKGNAQQPTVELLRNAESTRFNETSAKSRLTTQVHQPACLIQTTNEQQSVRKMSRELHTDVLGPACTAQQPKLTTEDDDAWGGKEARNDPRAAPSVKLPENNKENKNPHDQRKERSGLADTSSTQSPDKSDCEGVLANKRAPRRENSAAKKRVGFSCTMRKHDNFLRSTDINTMRCPFKKASCEKVFDKGKRRCQICWKHFNRRGFAFHIKYCLERVKFRMGQEVANFVSSAVLSNDTTMDTDTSNRENGGIRA